MEHASSEGQYYSTHPRSEHDLPQLAIDMQYVKGKWQSALISKQLDAAEKWHRRYEWLVAEDIRLRAKYSMRGAPGQDSVCPQFVPTSTYTYGAQYPTPHDQSHLRDDFYRISSTRDVQDLYSSKESSNDSSEYANKRVVQISSRKDDGPDVIWKENNHGVHESYFSDQAYFEENKKDFLLLQFKGNNWHEWRNEENWARNGLGKDIFGFIDKNMADPRMIEFFRKVKRSGLKVKDYPPAFPKNMSPEVLAGETRLFDALAGEILWDLHLAKPYNPTKGCSDIVYRLYRYYAQLESTKAVADDAFYPNFVNGNLHETKKGHVLGYLDRNHINFNKYKFAIVEHKTFRPRNRNKGIILLEPRTPNEKVDDIVEFIKNWGMSKESEIGWDASPNRKSIIQLACDCVDQWEKGQMPSGEKERSDEQIEEMQAYTLFNGSLGMTQNVYLWYIQKRQAKKGISSEA